MRDIITLGCEVCKNRNYSTTKNKRTMTDKLELKKYCKFCRKHTLHRETK
ncbi:50S ribosomal protein L33 [Desulfurispira natronophila]|uniref:Large ribosomal subunit protein bL33 n=1 Tax=Desulfurispira natronophila TaxID=682562 RepID=A0A7W7Y552_9BACT|nr:50S ribosomal protein L33 [Desulfurispira natronophila]MBB5022288.1 large subunit ribosomal protein L33 [Desulfurispira natronophila]